jgi:hypothetical protein
MSTVTLLTAALQASDDGLTLREIVDAVPTDPAAIFTILLVVGSVALVLWAGRGSSGKGGRPA